MQRRAAGLVMVIITVVGMLIINAMAGRMVSGEGARTPVPKAPGSGMCLSVDRMRWTATKCSDPHTAEVVQSWSAPAASDVSLYEKCMAAGRAYLGDQWGQSGESPTRSGWSVPPVMSSTMLVFGPGSILVSGWSWRACVIRPIMMENETAGYRGRMRDVPDTGVLPVELRPCFNRLMATSVVGVACSARHTGEVLAARSLQVFGSDTAEDSVATSPEVEAQCLGIARRTTAAADPTFGGRLQVVVNLHPTGMGFVVSRGSAENASRSYVLYLASCALQAATGHELSASIVGLAAGPLPLH